MEISSIVIAALLGAFIGGMFLWLPGIGTAALAGILLTRFGSTPLILADPEMLPVFFAALAVGGSFASIIPAFFFGAPHPAGIFLAVPGERYRQSGRALPGALTVGKGCLAGILLLAAFAPLIPYFYGSIQSFFGKHPLWVPAGLVLFMLGGEFIFHLRRADSGHRRGEYRALWLAPLIFLLVGLFGLLLAGARRFSYVTGGRGIYVSALIGLFLFPPLIQRALGPGGDRGGPDSRSRLSRRIGGGSGAAAGGIGGLLAFLIPGIWAGPGALIAGHLLPRKRERAFLFSQGMVQSFTAAGAFLVFFLPERSFIRSGLARAISPYHHPGRHLNSYLLAAGVILAAGGLSYLIFILTARLARNISVRVTPRPLSAAIAVFVLGIVCFLYGPAPLPILFTGACLGSLPILFNCRRSNTFAVTLVPFLLFTLDWYQPVLRFLGLA